MEIHRFVCHSQLLNYCCVSVRKILRAACQLNRPVTVLTMENSYTSRTKSSKLLQQSSLNYLYFAVLARTRRDAMSMNSPSVDSFHLHPIRAKLLQHFTSCNVKFPLPRSPWHACRSRCVFYKRSSRSVIHTVPLCSTI